MLPYGQETLGQGQRGQLKGQRDREQQGEMELAFVCNRTGPLARVSSLLRLFLLLGFNGLFYIVIFKM